MRPRSEGRRGTQETLQDFLESGNSEDYGMYDLLHKEIEGMRSRNFHMFEPVTAEELRLSVNSETLEVPQSYRRFLTEFGRARLYADARDVPKVAVYRLSLHRQIRLSTTDSYIEFGYFGINSAYFRKVLLGPANAGQVFGLHAAKPITTEPI
jgi:hypothetical protein